MANLSSRARRIASRIAELERQHQDDGEPPRMALVTELIDNGSTYRHESMPVTRQPNETEDDFYRRACSVFEADCVIGLIGIKPGDIPRDIDGCIDVAACTDDVLRELMDARRRVTDRERC